MKIRPVFIWISVLLLVLSIAGLVYLGTYTRFLADDFCMAGDAVHLGLYSMLVKWYNTWTGRFMFILGTGLFGLGGPQFAGWLPPMVAALWLVGIFWAVYPLFKLSGWPKPRLLSIITGCLIILVLFSTIPNLFQSFYWQDGMVNYSLPLIGLTFCCGIFTHVWLEETKALSTYIAIFLLAFLSSGFTEALTAMEITLFILLLILSLASRNAASRRRLSMILITALVGSLAAMIIVIIAPGNQVRLQAVGGLSAHPGVLRIFSFSLRNMAHIFGKFFLITPFWASISIMLPFLSGWLFSDSTVGLSQSWNLHFLWEQNWLRGIIYTAIIAIILVTAACAPVVYASNAYPEDRTIIIPQYAIVISIIFASALLGVGLRQLGLLPDPMKKASINRSLQIGILIIIFVMSGSSIWHTSKQIPEFRAYQKLWDKRSAMIQQIILSGETEVTVPGKYNRFGVADISEDPNYWVNRCMAYYYNISQIEGR
jgi:hypothetical protein